MVWCGAVRCGVLVCVCADLHYESRGVAASATGTGSSLQVYTGECTALPAAPTTARVPRREEPPLRYEYEEGGIGRLNVRERAVSVVSRGGRMRGISNLDAGVPLSQTLGRSLVLLLGPFRPLLC